MERSTRGCRTGHLLLFHQDHPLSGFQCINLNPVWGKGYARKGAALHGARRYDEAIAAYEKGIEYEDSPALRKGLQEVKDAQGSLASYPGCVED